MKKSIKTIGHIWLVIIWVTLTISIPVSAQESKRILIVPFEIHAADEHAFLKAAVTDMLYSRLSQNNQNLSVIKLKINEAAGTLEDAIALGQRQNVGFVLMGSITILDTFISTDARLIDITSKADIVTYNQVGQTQGEIIAHLEQLTARINATLSEKTVALTTPPPPAPTLPAPAVQTPRDKKELSLSYWKSVTFQMDINGIAIADIDGDGKNETIFIDDQRLHIYHYRNERLEVFQTISLDAFNNLIRLEAADINQNGKAEIVLTDFVTSQRRLKSMVLEWNGQRFEVVAEKRNWYLRILHTSPTETFLLGQKRGPGSSYISYQEALFDKTVYQMAPKNGQYDIADSYPLPRGLTLYDFAQWDATNDGMSEILSFSSNGQISVHNPEGDISWQSSTKFGGNRLYFEVPELDDHRRTTHYYLPQRIHIVDFDRDGQNEIILVKNHDSASLLSRLKAFKQAHIECLSLDDIGMQTKWQSRKISGYISDTTIGDLNNDGYNEIVFVGVEKPKSITHKGRSYIMTCKPVVD